mmetsp:Transcript_21973/g.61115  ORF Transcript_21973/g.61115 Transcript_21973/m.61115 type:complete len:211 (-) Transcript_21973:3563-4195(-)
MAIPDLPVVANQQKAQQGQRQQRRRGRTRALSVAGNTHGWRGAKLPYGCEHRSGHLRSRGGRSRRRGRGRRPSPGSVRRRKGRSRWLWKHRRRQQWRQWRRRQQCGIHDRKGRLQNEGPITGRGQSSPGDAPKPFHCRRAWTRPEHIHHRSIETPATTGRGRNVFTADHLHGTHRRGIRTGLVEIERGTIGQRRGRQRGVFVGREPSHFQ